MNVEEKIKLAKVYLSLIAISDGAERLVPEEIKNGAVLSALTHQCYAEGINDCIKLLDTAFPAESIFAEEEIYEARKES